MIWQCFHQASCCIARNLEAAEHHRTEDQDIEIMHSVNVIELCSLNAIEVSIVRGRSIQV
ncbi:hypothetical protein D9M72_400080 [compost metagenome]